MVVRPEELDLTSFERAVRDSREGAAAVRARSLREALALWHGPPLADFTYETFAQGEIARLEDLRLAALEERIDADLELGAHAELVGELEALVAEHPVRERLRGQLMLALYRSGRQAEALEAYRTGRRALTEELGIEPTPSLQRLNAAILRQDPSLDARRRAAGRRRRGAGSGPRARRRKARARRRARRPRRRRRAAAPAGRGRGPPRRALRLPARRGARAGARRAVRRGDARGRPAVRRAARPPLGRARAGLPRTPPWPSSRRSCARPARRSRSSSARATTTASSARSPSAASPSTRSPTSRAAATAASSST